MNVPTILALKPTSVPTGDVRIQMEIIFVIAILDTEDQPIERNASVSMALIDTSKITDVTMNMLHYHPKF